MKDDKELEGELKLLVEKINRQLTHIESRKSVREPEDSTQEAKALKHISIDMVDD